MGDPEKEAGNNTPAKQDSKETETLPAVLSGVLSGADTLFNGDTHVGVAIEVSADGKISHVMIPDATRVTEGQPIYITRAISLKGENLAAFLSGKGVTLTAELGRLLKNTSISCDAFYLAPKKRAASDEEKKDDKITKVDGGKNIDESVILMMFAVEVDKGLIGTLSHDESLGKLFDINGVKLRVLRCPASSRPVLEAYARQLAEA